MGSKSKIFFTIQILSFLREAKSKQHKLGFHKGYEYTNLRDAMFNLLLEHDYPLCIDTSRYNSIDTSKLKNQLAKGIAAIVKNKLNLERPNVNNSKNVYSIAKVLLLRSG